MDDAELRELATKRLKARTDFYHFLWVWLGIAILLTVIWLLTSGWGTYYWPGWAIGGLAIAAFFQAINVFGPVRGVITEDKITQEMNRLRGSGS